MKYKTQKIIIFAREMSNTTNVLVNPLTRSNDGTFLSNTMIEEKKNVVGSEVWNVGCKWDYFKIWDYASFKIIYFFKKKLKPTFHMEMRENICRGRIYQEFEMKK